MTLSSVVAAWDQLPPGLGFLPVANAVILVGLLPVMAYRVWRWRQHRSPATAMTAVAAGGLWLWVLLSWCWEFLPPVIQAMEICGGPGVIMVSVLQVFVVSLRRKIQSRQMWLVAAAGSSVLAVMAAAMMVGNATSLDLLSYRFDVAGHPNNAGLIVALVAANLYIAAVLVQVVWLGLRSADNTPTGWGVGLLAVGSASCLVSVAHDGIAMRSTAAGDPGFVWFKAVPAVVAVLCIVAGFTAPPLVLYLQARRKQRQLNPIRQHLIDALPNLDAPLAPGISHTDVVHEWCSQIQDGLTLTAQQRYTPLSGAVPPTMLNERADAVAGWLAGIPEPNLNCQWLTTPEAVTGQAWMLAIAAAYQRYVSEVGLSGSPSAVRR
ncbi:hypothetical protein [Mycobacteroides sp. LB1]|uniref:hypothetical protein n=1 Tax=Mycobacteroides sp. LB1 TaxID=2750814 RepID=UPI0015DE0F3D|nr:hypothetical protein [Mycobacteroides sp. LB1]